MNKFSLILYKDNIFHTQHISDILQVLLKIGSINSDQLALITRLKGKACIKNDTYNILKPIKFQLNRYGLLTAIEAPKQHLK